jgi:hypothetical protein
MVLRIEVALEVIVSYLAICLAITGFLLVQNCSWRHCFRLSSRSNLITHKSHQESV